MFSCILEASRNKSQRSLLYTLCNCHEGRAHFFFFWFFFLIFIFPFALCSSCLNGSISQFLFVFALTHETGTTTGIFSLIQLECWILLRMSQYDQCWNFWQSLCVCFFCGSWMKVLTCKWSFFFLCWIIVYLILEYNTNMSYEDST